MDRMTKAKVKLAKSQLRMAERTLAGITLPFKPEHESDRVAYGAFHARTSAAYLQEALDMTATQDIEPEDS